MRKPPLLGFGLIFRGALGLNLVGFENTIRRKAAVSKRYSVIPERIRKRVGACINDIQRFSFLMKSERSLCSTFHNRSRLDIPANPQPFALRRFAHLLEFGDRLVVRFGVADPTYGKP